MRPRSHSSEVAQRGPEPEQALKRTEAVSRRGPFPFSRPQFPLVKWEVWRRWPQRLDPDVAFAGRHGQSPEPCHSDTSSAHPSSWASGSKRHLVFSLLGCPKVKIMTPGSHSHSLRAWSSAETGSLGPHPGLGCLNAGIPNLGLTWFPFLDDIHWEILPVHQRFPPPPKRAILVKTRAKAGSWV